VGRSPWQWVLANGKTPPEVPIAEYLIRYVEDLNDARTTLTGFFSILLDVEELVGNLVGGERVEHGHDPPCEFEV
jgi:hypothetical protein